MTTPPPQKLHFGTSRITRGWARIGIALPLAALCAITRTVAIDPDRRLVAVIPSPVTGDSRRGFPDAGAM